MIESLNVVVADQALWMNEQRRRSNEAAIRSILMVVSRRATWKGCLLVAKIVASVQNNDVVRGCRAARACRPMFFARMDLTMEDLTSCSAHTPTAVLVDQSSLLTIHILS